MVTAPPPSKPAAPKPKSARGKATQQDKPPVAVSSSRGRLSQGERIGIYGPGGIGKTELVMSLQDVGIDPLYIDLDAGTMGLDVARGMAGEGLASSFDEVRAILQYDELIDQHGAVVIDTFSTLEERVREWVIENVPHEKSKAIRSIEDYGFGKGLIHIFEAALLVLQDLDAIARRGIHVVVVCHQCAERVPSADSEDYLEYQPRLQSPPKAGKLRERIFEWCNHFFRIDHDRIVDDGKAETGDVRTIHTVRSTTAWAKHRTLGNGKELPETIPYEKGSSELWQIMFGE